MVTFRSDFELNGRAMGVFHALFEKSDREISGTHCFYTAQVTYSAPKKSVIWHLSFLPYDNFISNVPSVP